MTSACTTGDESRTPRRKRPPTPDWRALGALMTEAEKARLNRAHRTIDTLVADLLLRSHREDAAGPAALAAARLAELSGAIPWLA